MSPSTDKHLTWFDLTLLYLLLVVASLVGALVWCWRLVRREGR